MRVYSFVPPSGTVKEFSADVKEFYKYLEQKYQFPSSKQNVIGEFSPTRQHSQCNSRWLANLRTHPVFQIGSEAFTGGPATFTVSQFSADVI